MRLLRIFPLVLLLTLQETPVMAANEFEDSIPLDVAEALFDYGDTGRFRVYSDIMDEFPAFQIPDGFTVLGSAFFMRSMRVALFTELGVEEAVQVIEESFTSDGWVTIPGFNPLPNRTGFVSANQVEFSRRSICHDEFGQLSVTTKSSGARNQVILSMSAGLRRSWTTCAQLIAQQEQQLSMMQGRGRLGFQQYMPQLLMPDEANTGQRPAFMLGGISSSNNSAETDMELEIDWSMEEVYRYFADQMAEQEWALDTESIGSVSASGTWTQSPEANTNIMSTFNVVSLGENRFQLKLNVEGLGGRAGDQGLGVIIRGN